MFLEKKTEVLLDSVNYVLYKDPIEYETGKVLNVTNDSFFLDGKLLEKYTFKQNYYFVVGDLAFNSEDSRYWGLLPEDHIVGKISYIWRSKDINTNEYRFKRFLKAVD